MEVANIALDVPGIPAVADSMAVIAETPVSTSAAPLNVPTVPYVHVSASVFSNCDFPKGMLKISPTVVGRTAINDYTPILWFQWGNFLIIEPIPIPDYNAEYQILLHIADYPRWDLNQYYPSPEELPEEFHPCIVDFACYCLSLRLKKWKQAAKYYNLYIKNLKQRKRDYMSRMADRRGSRAIPDNVK